MDRRSFLKWGAASAGATVVGATVVGARFIGAALPRAFAAGGPYGALQAADANGVVLPAGFSSRVVAVSGEVVPGTGYTWHTAPDGGACFAAPSGGTGWTYVSNSELSPGGGVSALRCRGDGSIASASRILDGTHRNCAGGATPWGTWLSCEEVADGLVYECDPMGGKAAIVRPALGRFRHEAAACDPVRQCVYLTEDDPTGKLRRFRPTAWPDLAAGVLEAAVVRAGRVSWTTSVDAGTAFNGGEGAWYAEGRLWFTTKGDNQVWELDGAATPNTIRVIYDDSLSPTPVLTGVDNIVGSASGDLFVAEDGGNMELVLIEPSGAVSVFLRVLNQDGSEITGPAFSPDGISLYFSSQRGPTGTGAGVTYEVSGPFRPAVVPPSTTTSVTAVAPAIILTGRGRTRGTRHTVDLQWTGAKATNVEIGRNDVVVATTRNNRAYTDDLGALTGTFRYRVSHPGGSPTSNEVSVTF